MLRGGEKFWVTAKVHREKLSKRNRRGGDQWGHFREKRGEGRSRRSAALSGEGVKKGKDD